MTPVVGVHGVWNYWPDLTAPQAAERLSAVWTANLTRSSEPTDPVPVSVAYYADRLRPGRHQGVVDPDNLTETERRWLTLWDQAAFPRDEVGEGAFTRPARQVLDGMARRGSFDRGPLTFLVLTMLRELRIYFDPKNPRPRQTARAAVADVIRREAPTVVIAHSMGSIVAYETLWTDPNLAVNLLVTIGSPLGLPGVVLPRLEAGPSEPRRGRPPGVREWVNLADPGDLCAIPRWLSACFDGIDADLEAPVGTFAFHRVANYLACPMLGTLVRREVE